MLFLLQFGLARCIFGVAHSLYVNVTSSYGKWKCFIFQCQLLMLGQDQCSSLYIKWALNTSGTHYSVYN